EARLEDGDSCGARQSCVDFDNPGNLNYIEIAPEKGYLKIDSIRELQRAARFKTDNETRVIVVDGADAMGVEPANAFLKTLEEPTPGTLIVLLSSRPSILLPTIISRCQRINFSPLPLDTVAALLQGLDVDSTLSRDEVLSLASYSLGSVSRALDAMRSGLHEGGEGSINEAAALLASLLDGTMDVPAILKCAAKLAKDDNLPVVLEVFKSSIRDLAIAGEGAMELVINKNNGALATKGQSSLDFKEIDRKFSAVDRAKRDMMPPRNANKLLALEAVFMELSR
ncbi:MAG: hypothetical protein IME98_05135, partial [Proteobacteria bacterium]|nr:hypothetical protein [Pseudomonadota bacterium]